MHKIRAVRLSDTKAGTFLTGKIKKLEVFNFNKNILIFICYKGFHIQISVISDVYIITVIDVTIM